jgi:hypothetical protein
MHKWQVGREMQLVDVKLQIHIILASNSLEDAVARTKSIHTLGVSTDVSRASTNALMLSLVETLPLDVPGGFLIF